MKNKYTPSKTTIFIAWFKKKYWEDIENFFLNWGCKIFSDILVKNFWWKQYHYLWHYITEIESRYWDITGELYPNKDNLDLPWFCPDMEKRMYNYSNIVDLVMYDLLTNTFKNE